MKNKHSIRLLALLLAIGVLLCPLSACGGGEIAKPETVEELVETVAQVMAAVPYQCVSTEARRVTDGGALASELDATTVSTARVDGTAFFLSLAQGGTLRESTYREGIYYLHVNGGDGAIDLKRSVSITAEQLALYGASAASYTAFFQDITFSDLMWETAENGNIIVTGSGVEEESSTGLERVIGDLSAALMPHGASLTVDYRETFVTMEVDARTYQCLRQRREISGEILLLDQIIPFTLTTEEVYSYGEAAVVTPPADANTYEKKSSFAELFEM